MGRKRQKTAVSNSKLDSCEERPGGAVKRTPEVIVFQEPGKVKTERKVIQNRPGLSRKMPGVRNQFDKQSRNDELDFSGVAREIREFGATGLRRGDRKKFEQEKLRKLGAQKKKCKVPYPVGMERIKLKREKEAREQERDRAMGVIRKKARDEQYRHKKMKRNFGRWVDKAPDLEKLSGGRSFKKINIKNMK